MPFTSLNSHLAIRKVSFKFPQDFWWLGSDMKGKGAAVMFVAILVGRKQQEAKMNLALTSTPEGTFML